MYWPNGVPRVYAINGPRIPVSRSDDEGDIDREEEPAEQSRPLNQHNEPAQSSAESSQWADEAIRGLCVSRNGHMFATMTDSSISVWQTRVRED
jgi:hypothetical protein